MSIANNVSYALGVVSQWKDEDAREKAHDILSAAARSIFDSPRQASATECVAQLRVHATALEAAEKSFAGGADLIRALEGLGSNKVTFIAFASEAGRVALYFRGDELFVGGYVLSS